MNKFHEQSSFSNKEVKKKTLGKVVHTVAFYYRIYQATLTRDLIDYKFAFCSNIIIKVC